MEINKFKELLFDIACCAVACDYDIDDREIKELRQIGKSTAYFKNIDTDKQLESFLRRFRRNEADTINHLLQTIGRYSMSLTEELLILEVVLRLIYADTKIDEKELNYLQAVRSELKISDELIKERFGEIPLIIRKQEIQKAESKNILKSPIQSVDVSNIEKIYFQGDESKKKK
jgi:uncharacterized tellurite resistance protein B-like protein